MRGFDRFEGVAADQLGEAVGLMRRRYPHGAHLVEGHTQPSLGKRPGGLAAGETAADDVYVVTSSASGAASSTSI